MTSYNTMTNDRPKQRLNYQCQASIHLNWQMLDQYDVIFYRQLIYMADLSRQGRPSILFDRNGGKASLIFWQDLISILFFS